MRFLIRFLINAAALWIATQIVPGVEHTGPWTSLLLVALVFGVLNAVVRPILTFFTLPLTIVTLGLFLLVVNAAMFSLTAYFLEGFTVAGFWPALFGGLVMSVVNWVGQMVIGPHEAR